LIYKLNKDLALKQITDYNKLFIISKGFKAQFDPNIRNFGE